MKSFKIFSLFILLCFTINQSQAITLDQLIARTLKTNFKLNAARASVKYQYHKLKASYAELFPSVNVLINTGYVNNKTTDTTLKQAKDSLKFSRNIGVSVSQNLFNGGATLYGIKNAKEAYYTQQYTKDVEKNSVTASVIQIYLDEMRVSKLISLSQANIKTHEKTLSTIQKKVNSSLSAKSDTFLAQSRLSLAKVQLRQLLDEKNSIDSSYVSITGLQPEDNMLMPKAPLNLPSTLSKAIEMAYANNPTIKASLTSLYGSEANIKKERAVFYPKLDLSISAYKGMNATGTQKDSADLDATINLSFNIFNGGSDYQTLRATASTRNQKKFKLYQAKNLLKQQISDRWKSLNTYRKLLLTQQKYVNQTASVLSVYKKQFLVGQRSLFELVDGERDVYTAETMLIESKFAYLKIQLDLAVSLGVYK